MINAKYFIKQLQNLDIDFFTGVPDSLMSEFSKSLHFDFNDENHIISTNEGSALATGMGYHLSTGNYPLIYLQNSGLGNLVNPYTSLLHKEIIPAKNDDSVATEIYDLVTQLEKMQTGRILISELQKSIETLVEQNKKKKRRATEERIRKNPSRGVEQESLGGDGTNEEREPNTYGLP